MRLSPPSYRALFYMMAVTAGVAVAFVIMDVRRLDAARRENELLTRANHFANTYTAYRDKDYSFIVENYGFSYRGKTGNLIDDCILKCGAWEKFMLFFLEDYTQAAGLKETAFVDVGANTGVHSLFMSTRIKEVHAFDPDPVILKRLHANIALNQFKNIHVHEVGLGDREALLPFYAPDGGNEGNGSFRTGDRERMPAGNLKIVRGDDFLKSVKHAPVGIIKVDIEGFEEAGLKGLRQTMETHRPLVIVEVTVAPQGTIAGVEQLQNLFPANYTILSFVEDDRHYLSGRYEIVEFAPIAAKFFQSEDHRNLIAVPNEKLPVLPPSKVK